MRALVALLTLWISTSTLLAQSSYQRFHKDSTYYLLADKVNIRSTPGTSGEKICQLPIGTSIKVEEITDKKLTIDGIAGHWLKVSYKQKDNTNGTGYVWGSLVASGSAKSKTDKGLHFLYGIDELNFSGEYAQIVEVIIQLRAVKENKQLSKVTFKAVGSLSTYNNLVSLGNKQVPQVKEVLQLNFSDDMCAGAFGDAVIFWDGAKLHHAKTLTDGADAPYYYDEELIYPADEKGQKGKIIMTIESGGDEESESYETRTLIWTGTKLKSAN